jgi:hypothetical protein
MSNKLDVKVVEVEPLAKEEEGGGGCGGGSCSYIDCSDEK